VRLREIRPCTLLSFDQFGLPAYEHCTGSDIRQPITQCVQARDKMRRRADQNGDNLPINRHLQLRLGLGLRIVVYKLLENVAECGSVT